MRAILAIVVAISLLMLGGCEDAQALKSQEKAQKLVGTWLREVEVADAKARRVLVLGPDGKFSESLVAEFAGGRKAQEERSGEWAFDGTNLKRKYTHEDGRQLSGNFNFATFELTALSEGEFYGKNHAKGEEIHYRRVPQGTKP